MSEFGFNTEHGFLTEHSYPLDGIDPFLAELFHKFTNSLYPTGKAFALPLGGNFDKLHKAINNSFVRLVQDCNSFLDSQFPDNDNFTIKDCILWEYRLGISASSLTPLVDRKNAILQKMAYPGKHKYRLSKEFLQEQITAAGFNVTVFENKFFQSGQWIHKTPAQIATITLKNTQHANATLHGGGTVHGSTGFEVIANEAKNTPENFVIGSGNLWSTFFLCGSTIGSYATVPVTRQIEFKELILKYKPAHLTAFSFINYL